MHQDIYKVFNEICGYYSSIKSVLEVGPIGPGFLTMPSLHEAKERVGINLGDHVKGGRYEVLKCNANKMFFPDGKFDAVLCNAMLEHDKYFWKSVSEMKRVLRPKNNNDSNHGGLLVLGVPAFVADEKYSKLANAVDSTITFKIHNMPGDYWRFSPQAVKEVLFEGMESVQMKIMMTPPRVIGWGLKI